MPISGLEKVDPDILVYHNGTAFGTDAAGREQAVHHRRPGSDPGGPRAASLGEARAKAYENIKRIRFNGMRYRKDIGLGYRLGDE